MKFIKVILKLLYLLCAILIIGGIGVFVIGIAMNFSGVGTETKFYVFFNDSPLGWGIMFGSIIIGIVGKIILKKVFDIDLDSFSFWSSKRDHHTSMSCYSSSDRSDDIDNYDDDYDSNSSDESSSSDDNSNYVSSTSIYNGDGERIGYQIGDRYYDDDGNSRGYDVENKHYDEDGNPTGYRVGDREYDRDGNSIGYWIGETFYGDDGSEIHK